MWFVTLLKLRKAPSSPAEAEGMIKLMVDPGGNISQGFVTLGAYDEAMSLMRNMPGTK